MAFMTHIVITVYGDGSLCYRIRKGRKLVHEAYHRGWIEFLLKYRYLDIHSEPLHIRATKAR